ncbi:MAG: hypothetical protein ACWGOX_01140 [Desulforhopalus sp.]
MEIYGIRFACHRMAIGYDSAQAAAFLELLFSDLSCMPFSTGETRLLISRLDDTGMHAISSDTGNLFCGPLGVQAAAVLYDSVIYNLLNANSSGIALHAGAVAHGGKLLLIPGESGAGKSSVVAWLTSHGFSYVTDELVFLRGPVMHDIVPFTRPICLKATSAQAFSAEIPTQTNTWLRDESGAIIPHRSLNTTLPGFQHPPALLLFPRYKQHAATKIDDLSRAQASTRLMACCANGRNLEGHGFGEIVELARSLPSYQLTFSSFDGLEEAVKELVQTEKTGNSRQ